MLINLLKDKDKIKTHQILVNYIYLKYKESNNLIFHQNPYLMDLHHLFLKEMLLKVLLN